MARRAQNLAALDLRRLVRRMLLPKGLVPFAMMKTLLA